ncbi:MAG: hypothetical protein HQK79_08435 [Desulfobacterales bacterium]|nr:hypothetical protein [Desulfobacterales bacterium]MBF0398217.1 hypothetical protein [Desulfobacterales bacterium]
MNFNKILFMILVVLIALASLLIYFKKNDAVTENKLLEQNKAISSMKIETTTYIPAHKNNISKDKKEEKKEATSEQNDEEDISSVTPLPEEAAPFIPNLGEAKSIDKDAYKKEIEQMKEVLPGNMMIPYELSAPESKEQNKLFSEIFMLEKKVNEGLATKEEKKEYYANKIKMAKDQIDIIKYYQGKIKKIETENGSKHLSQDDLKDADKKIEELNKELEEFKAKIASLNQ